MVKLTEDNAVYRIHECTVIPSYINMSAITATDNGSPVELFRWYPDHFNANFRAFQSTCWDITLSFRLVSPACKLKVVCICLRAVKFEI